MAKKIHEPDAGADIENLENELDDVSIKAEVRKVGGGGKIVPIPLAKALLQKFEKDGAFAVPKEWLEKKIGLDTNKAMKGRPNAIKIKLNKQHGDLAGDGKIWHVGDSGGNYYLLSILDANATEEDKWKHWKPSTKKEI